VKGALGICSFTTGFLAALAGIRGGLLTRSLAAL